MDAKIILYSTLSINFAEVFKRKTVCKVHQPTIHIENLSIGYTSRHGVRRVARNLTADICAGELTCLLGANGVGKSTLMRTLSGFQPKLEGSVRISGREVSDYTPGELARMLSVVLTEQGDVRGMTVSDLVGLGRSPYTGFWGTLTEEDRKRVDRALDLVGIRHLADCMADMISDGERQKVMIAKALAQETPVICLDEPTAFLDFPSKVEMMQLLHRLSREMNKTIFLSTHDLELALQLADKLWLMGKEAGISVGTPEDLALDGCLERFFVRKGIVFDREAGLFRAKHTCASQIRLEGEGRRYLMVRKALLRNGVDACREVESESYIRAGQDGDPFVLHDSGGGTREVSTIEEIIEWVRDIVITSNHTYI